MILDKNHFIYQASHEIYQLSKVFYDDTGFYFLNHIKLFDDGSVVSLNSAIAIDWVTHFFLKHYKEINFDGRLNIGINYWEKNSAQSLSIITEDARNNFDIDARIELVYRDEINKCFNMYSFYATRKNADKAYSFYNIHRSKLLKFIGYFNCQARHIIAEGCRPENKIHIPNHTPPDTSKIKRDYMTELQFNNSHCKLTDREFEIMIIYAAGFTGKQVSGMLHRSISTIENHIAKIHKKTGCKDKAALRKHVINNGWNDLERFFFSYIPDTIH